MEVRVDGIDLTSDNAYSQSGHGFRLRARSLPLKRCPKGYRPSHQGLCLDVDECGERLAGCKESQECENLMGSYRCRGFCKDGYRLLHNGTCTDVDECSLGLGECSSGEECENSQGGYNCLAACPIGFRRLAGECLDVDECREEIPCGPGKLCLNTHGSYTCLCPPGFKETVRGGPCMDLDECAGYPCEMGCENTPGSFICTCPPGTAIAPDARSCTGVTLDPEHPGLHDAYPPFTDEERRPSGRARFMEGGTCPTGFHWDGVSCVDLDECSVYRPCQGDCENTEGSYRCLCPDGFRLSPDGTNCLDIDECSEGMHNCPWDSLCFNTRGTFQCLSDPCPQHYTLDPNKKECRLSCVLEGVACGEETRWRPGAIRIQLVSLPLGVAPRTDLLRLSAFDAAGHRLPQTRFAIKNAAQYPNLPFAIRLEAGVGTLYSVSGLGTAGDFRLHVRASSFAPGDHTRRFSTDFLVFIAVSPYPF